MAARTAEDGVQLETDIGCLVVLDNPSDVVFVLPHSPIFMPSLCFCAFSDMLHRGVQCVKMLFTAFHPLQLTHTYTHDPTFTLTHAHTCAQWWLLKVLTWAMPLCQLFPVGRLSTCLIFHACSEFLSSSKLTVDADFIVSNKVFRLNPAPTHTSSNGLH